MGRVYKALAVAARPRVALKILGRRPRPRPNFYKRFFLLEASVTPS